MNNEKNNEKPVLLDRANDISAFASTDESRYVINGIFVNGKTTEATDGRILIRVPFVETPHDEFPVVANVTHQREQVIVPIKPLKEALAKADANKSKLPVLNCVRVSTRNNVSGLKIQMATTDLENERLIESKPIDGNYPNIDQVIPTAEPTLAICFSANYLKLIADYAIRHGKGDQHPVVFKFTDALSALRYEVKLEDGRTAVGVLMPMRMS